MDAEEYRATDKLALEQALLALRICPKCQEDLVPVRYFLKLWGCRVCQETWYLEKETV